MPAKFNPVTTSEVNEVKPVNFKELFKDTPTDNDTFVQRDAHWQELLKSMKSVDITIVTRYAQSYWESLEKADLAAKQAEDEMVERRLALAHEMEAAASLWMVTSDDSHIRAIGDISLRYGGF